MATGYTHDTSAYDNNVGKRPTINALLSSKLKIFTVKVTYGSTQGYTGSGGNAVSLKEGKINTYIAVIPTYNSKALKIDYDKTNEKITCYGQHPTNATTGVIAFEELADADTTVNSMVAEFLVIGY